VESRAAGIAQPAAGIVGFGMGLSPVVQHINSHNMGVLLCLVKQLVIVAQYGMLSHGRR